MIPHPTEKHVSSSTTAKERSQVSLDRYLEIEREVLWLRQSKEESDRDLIELLTEIKSLRERLARLKAQNQVLNNCWLKEQENYTRAATEVRVWAGRCAFKDSEIGAASLRLEESTAKCLELRRQVEELEGHLNLAGEIV